MKAILATIALVALSAAPSAQAANSGIDVGTVGKSIGWSIKSHLHTPWTVQAKATRANQWSVEMQHPNPWQGYAILFMGDSFDFATNFVTSPIFVTLMKPSPSWWMLNLPRPLPSTGGNRVYFQWVWTLGPIATSAPNVTPAEWISIK